MRGGARSVGAKKARTTATKTRSGSTPVAFPSDAKITTSARRRTPPVKGTSPRTGRPQENPREQLTEHRRLPKTLRQFAKQLRPEQGGCESEQERGKVQPVFHRADAIP